MNHFEKAEQLLDEALEYESGSRAERSRLEAARIHATLALAEQQKIANLQTFADRLERNLKDALVTYQEEPEKYAVLETIGGQVVEGLGL